jgi:hypothetical protein
MPFLSPLPRIFRFGPRALKAVAYQIASRIHRLSRITVAKALSGVFTLLAFLVVTLFSVIQRGHYDLGKGSDWLRMLGAAWPLILAALYLKYKDPVQRLFEGDKEKRLAWKTRKLRCALVLQRMEYKIPRGASELLRIRTELLFCVASSVSEMLDLPRDSLCANLLGFTQEDFAEMEVLARSEQHRFVSGTIHEVTPEFGPWIAIQRAQAHLEDDVRDDERWSRGPKPPYRSILILPIVRYNKAYGAMTVDCTQPYAFASNSLNLEILVQPYIALLSATFGPNSLCMECAYSPPRH